MKKYKLENFRTFDLYAMPNSADSAKTDEAPKPLTAEKLKSVRKSAWKIAVTELLSMRGTFLYLNSALLAGAVLLMFRDGEANIPLLTGILAGNVLMIANFLSLGYVTGETLRKSLPKKAEVYANAAYGIRLIAMFAVCAVLLGLKLVHILTLLVPLFIPKVHYLTNGLRGKNI